MRKKIFFAVLAILAAAAPVLAVNVTLNAGTSKIISIKNANAVELEDDSIATARVISENEALIRGVKAGTSGVTFYTDGGKVNYSVNVVSTITGRKMVQMDAQVMEVGSTNGFTRGIDWNAILGRSSPTDSNPFVSPLNVRENMKKDESGNPDSGLVYLRTLSRGQLNFILDFLVNGNHAKILAKPKLISASGKGAKFLSGGEIPVPVADADGKVTVEWKTYGVHLNITPTLSPDNKYITADIEVEVSNVDKSNAVQVGAGGSVPAMRTRNVQTSIDLAPEETIVIAGLLSSEKSTVTSEVPVLSGIPLLGELFKHTDESEVQTELVIFVTPKVITK